MPRFVKLDSGDPAPRIMLGSATNPQFAVDTAAGRYLVLCFFHTASHPAAQRALSAARRRPDLFDDSMASFFGITSDPADQRHLADSLPGYRYLWDFGLEASRLYGACAQDGASDQPRQMLWIVTDPTLRIIEVIPFAQDGGDLPRLFACLDALPPPDRFAGRPLQAPILFLPRVLEPDLCRTLIGLYDAQGGELSGVMRQQDGKTIGVHDAGHKVRRDVYVEEAGLIARLQSRILRRVVPEIAKIHQFHVTRMERYLIGCYDAAEGGHFRPHRDNTTAGTAHRRFAVSVNLNDDFEGGEVFFPEYGPQGFKAPAGGAVVFSCSLLHAVSPVTRGRRYAFLPFLYDEAAAVMRANNLHAVEGQQNAASAGQATARTG